MSESVINGFHIYHGFLSGYLSVLDKQSEMNRINVFPVSDGDTGNNVTRTIRSVILGTSPRKSAGDMMRTLAERSLEGARGNSGMILSQFLNGLYLRTKGKEHLTISEFGQITKDAVKYAYSAMEVPQEGTILTVLRVWSEAVLYESHKGGHISCVLSKAFHAAREALNQTTGQLKVLKQHNVVDAGALGFVSFLEGVEKLISKGPVSIRERKTLKKTRILKAEKHHEPSLGGPDSLTFRYCSEFLLEDTEVSSVLLREELKEWGDSLIVGQGEDRLRIHIHTDTPDELSALLNEKGKIVQQKVDDMLRQNQAVNHRKGVVAIVTDSIADIPLSVQDELQIHMVPLNLIWGEREYLDRTTISPEEFYRQQSLRKDFPSSSLPEIQRIDTLYSFLLDHYDNILVLPVARALSGTFQQMIQASEEYNREEHRIHVMDTRLNSAAQGLLVCEVAREAVKGASLGTLITLTEDLRSRVKIYVSLNTFKFMVKGGRVSPLKGFIATALNMKPIVTLDETGKGKAMDKAFSRQGLLKKISELLKETVQEKGIEKFSVVHALSEEKAREFASLVEDIAGKKAEFITSISPVVGMHSGRGAVAIGVIEGRGTDR